MGEADEKYLSYLSPGCKLKTKLRVSLVQPLGFAIIGAISGMGISAPLGPQFGWSLLPVVFLVGGGAVAGACFGCLGSRSGESNSSNSGASSA